MWTLAETYAFEELVRLRHEELLREAAQERLARIARQAQNGQDLTASPQRAKATHTHVVPHSLFSGLRCLLFPRQRRCESSAS